MSELTNGQLVPALDQWQAAALIGPACYTEGSFRHTGVSPGGPHRGPELVQSPRVANRVRAGRQQR